MVKSKSSTYFPCICATSRHRSQNVVKKCVRYLKKLLEDNFTYYKNKVKIETSTKV